MNSGVRFLQSALDHPCMVSLGERKPAWELNRWGRDVLRFFPLMGDSYTVRGDSKTLVYRGEKQNHRFTILDGERFEYDIILKNEPDSNTLYLEIAGWEAFDFFRQPDTLGPEILRGSYAVYKKEFVISGPKYHVGTGKICHIHRPLIWDSRGRKVWGDIWIDKGILAITIPEGWLGEAAYPVTVDPVFGSNTIGAYNQWLYISTESYQYYLEDKAAGYNPDLNDWIEVEKVLFEERSHFNRITASVPMQGIYEAYIYPDESTQNPKPGGGYYYDILGYPLAYNNVSSKPKYPLMNTSAGADCRVDSTHPKSFRKGTFNIADRINAGTEFWFGFSCGAGYFNGRFDYGGVYCPLGWGFIDATHESDYDDFNEMLVDYEMDELSSYHWDMRFIAGNSEYNAYPGARFDFKVSMYLQVSSQTYTRTLTQGIKLTDSRKLTGNYKRTATQTVKGSTTLGRFAVFPRQCLETVQNTVALKALPVFIRSVIEQVRAAMSFFESRGLARNIPESVTASLEIKRSQSLYRKAQEDVKGSDNFSFPVLFLRTLPETAAVTETAGHWGTYIRGLLVEAASMAETSYGGEYYRKPADTVQAEGTVFRGLLIFVRLLTTSLVRDFLLRRFLESNEELVLKSCVCREITLESSIH